MDMKGSQVPSGIGENKDQGLMWHLLYFKKLIIDKNEELKLGIYLKLTIERN
jgi:hypothetical protein